ncbi:hypothetical protein [Streptomyces sp. SID4985]|uniref:hypothetical protein n=1 Tax=unclassified Streptomyces TaxID=2593676 RepID=UPI0013802D80|nr:hypothetical protein [Streptomyces sp. SID4985]MYQ47681.1 hypothetical protein [Streptomyces sp. SID4985]
MGIRMRTERAEADPGRGGDAPAVPSLAADASSARIPVDPAARMRAALAALRRRAAALQWRARVDVARGYLALLLAALPKARPRHTLTVFVASLTERPSPPAPGQARPDAREPDAAP